MILAAQYQGSAPSNGNEGSWRTSAGLFPGWLGILQMFEQLFRFRIICRIPSQPGKSPAEVRHDPSLPLDGALP